MFNETQLTKYADVLIWAMQRARKNKFKKNDIIVIRYDKPTIELAQIVYQKILEIGMHPIQRMNLTSKMELSFFTASNNKQLTFLPPGDDELYSSLNGSIFLYAPESITHLSNIDPKKIAITSISRKRLRDILDKREEIGDFGWTLCIYPTQELANHANISIEEYSDQIISSCFLNDEFPVLKWQETFKEISKIKTWLNSLKIKKLHIESQNIDLEIYPGDKRKWAGISGHNIPSFEVFISPDYRKTRGIYYADQPSYRSGNYVKGIKIEFEKGVAINVSANEGEEFAKNQFSMDRGASRVGEFSLTDKTFSRINKFMANTLFDENYGGENGNCHLALGSSYSDTYDGDARELTKDLKQKLGFNDSALHWDLVNTENKRVTAYLKSGEKRTIYENGKFNS
ncbi:MAG: aminopeptidase [Desulfobacterales bacterium]|nr:aminopeptidase [Desulfobacterales bacterium]